MFTIEKWFLSGLRQKVSFFRTDNIAVKSLFENAFIEPAMQGRWHNKIKKLDSLYISLSTFLSITFLTLQVRKVNIEPILASSSTNFFGII